MRNIYGSITSGSSTPRTETLTMEDTPNPIRSRYTLMAFLSGRNTRNCKLFCLTISLLFYFSNTQADTIQTTVKALKNVYTNDFTIGCLLSYRHIGFSSDPVVSGQSAVVDVNGGHLIKFHMNCMSPGNNMKPLYTVDIAGSASAYNAAPAAAKRDSVETHPIIKFNADLVAQLNWAKRQGFTFRGHTLVWHSQTPDELFRSGYAVSGAYLSKQVMTQRMDNYIREVIRQIHVGWPGLLSAMDVVNEAIDDGTGLVRTTNNGWYTTFGDNTYIMKAFQLARKYATEFGETQMKLYYNDYNTSYSNKANGIVTLCKAVYDSGYLDGIGMQEHDSNSFPTADNWISSYNKFYPICSEMAITEFDISTQSGTNSPSSSVLATQANQYAMLFKCFVERSYKSGRGKIINVSKDGLNDQYTFVTNQSSSLWNTANQCKPSFYAVVDVGNHYNRLDTLIKYTEKLNQSDFTSEAWNNITTKLTAAKAALAKNYSASESAVTGLGNAITNLLSATQPTGIIDITNQVSFAASDGIIQIGNMPPKTKVYVYSFTGVLIKASTSGPGTITIPYTNPCIVKVIMGNSVKSYKVAL